MKLEVHEAVPADFETAKSIYGPERGDLCSPGIAAGWPLNDPNDTEAAKARAEWSAQQEGEIVEGNSTTRFVKVVDVEQKGEIVAFGRWHRYTKGYESVGDLEYAGCKDRDDPSTWPAGFQKDFYVGLLDDIFAARRNWMGTGHYWVLTSIKTREPLQKKGAGSLILKWGLAQALRERVPAYLEAVVEAKHLYESHGFREVGRHKFDCTPYGMPGVVFEVAKMKADPK